MVIETAKRYFSLMCEFNRKPIGPEKENMRTGRVTDLMRKTKSIALRDRLEKIVTGKQTQTGS